MEHLFWLNDEAWAAIEPRLPKNQPGARRVDDRRVISGIVHVLKSGSRWARLPRGLWSPHNDLQSLQSLVSPAHLATRGCNCRTFRLRPNSQWPPHHQTAVAVRLVR